MTRREIIKAITEMVDKISQFIVANGEKTRELMKGGHGQT